MPKVAITGATGFVGCHLMEKLNSAGWDPVPLVRRPSGLNSEVVVGALEAPKDHSVPAVDVFIHLAARTHVTRETHPDPHSAYRAINVKGTLSALEIALAAKARHFVFLSSVKANGEETETGHPFREVDAEAPVDFYGITKLEAEKLVRSFCEANGIAWTIIRPPLVYGPGVKANFQALASLISTRIPLPLRIEDNLRSFIFVGNLVDFIMFSLNNHLSHNNVFLVDDREPMSTYDLINLIAYANNHKPIVFRFPKKIIYYLMRFFKKENFYVKIFGNLEISSDKSRKIGWNPPFNSREGFLITFRKRKNNH